MYQNPWTCVAANLYICVRAHVDKHVISRIDLFPYSDCVSDTNLVLVRDGAKTITNTTANWKWLKIWHFLGENFGWILVGKFRGLKCAKNLMELDGKDSKLSRKCSTFEAVPSHTVTQPSHNYNRGEKIFFFLRLPQKSTFFVKKKIFFQPPKWIHLPLSFLTSPVLFCSLMPRLWSFRASCGCPFCCAPAAVAFGCCALFSFSADVLFLLFGPVGAGVVVVTGGTAADLSFFFFVTTVSKSVTSSWSRNKS